jgi:hypothetical protein
VVVAKDAGHLARKNPFGTIEATEYLVEFGQGVDSSRFKEALALLERMGPESPPETEAEDIEKFWGRVLSVDVANGSVRLMALQREGETLHGAHCASFLEKRLSLPHYPVFTKLDYYRLKPSRRRLFQ